MSLRYNGFCRIRLNGWDNSKGHVPDQTLRSLYSGDDDTRRSGRQLRISTRSWRWPTYHKTWTVCDRGPLSAPFCFPYAFYGLASLKPPTLLPAKTQTMRILSFIPALAALVTAVASVAVPDTCTGSEMKCVSGVGPKRELTQHPSRNLRAMTNAELLRRGLPLNRPVLRRGAIQLL